MGDGPYSLGLGLWIVLHLYCMARASLRYGSLTPTVSFGALYHGEGDVHCTDTLCKPQEPR
jgi:hypothetical protein